MNLLRLLIGWTCIAAALVLVAAAVLGGFAGLERFVPRSPASMAHLPGVVFGLALLAVGIWMLKKKKTSP
jgi:hypothetical protein